jgi:tRNA threonylcarbamoyl adenosine modification protein YjeE
MYRDAGQKKLFHMDAYRLDSAPEAEELDLDTMLAQGALIIEWPERMQKLIPDERLWVQLEYKNEEEREMKFKSSGKRYDDLLEGIRQATFGGD